MEGNKMGKDKINKNIMDKKMSRRKLLATMGAAGAAVVSGAMISGTGTGSEVSANPNREANENTYRYSGELPERTVGDKLREFVNVTDFGAVGDGVTDDSSAIQAAIDAVAASGGGTVSVSNGDYFIANTLHLYSYIHLQLEGKARLKFADHVSDGITASGSEGTSTALTSDVAKGDLVIPIANGASFQAGDLILIRDELRIAATNQPRRGEMHYVKETTATSITIEEGLWSDYKTSLNAQIVRISPLKQIRISGGIFEGGGVNAEQASAITLSYVDSVLIENITVKHWFYRGVVSHSSINGNIRNSQFEDISSPTLGYGTLMTSASQNWVVEKNNFLRCGKGFDLGGFSRDFGIVRFIWVQNNWVYGAFRGPISTHETGEYIYIFNNECFSDNPAVTGIFTRSANTEIARNRIWAAGIGIGAQNRSNQGFMKIKDNTIVRAGGSAIEVHNQDRGGADGVFDRVIIQGNSIEHVDGWGISATNGQAKKFKNIVIQNNEIGESELGILIRAMSGDIDEVMISNNKVRSTATAIYLVTSSNMLHAIPSVMISSNYAMGSNGIVGQRILDGRIQHFVQGNMTTSITGFEEEDLEANKIIE